MFQLSFNRVLKTQLEAKEAIENLSEGLERMKALSEYAGKQQAEAADMLQNVEFYIKNRISMERFKSHERCTHAFSCS